jgi:hypothetical protein
VQVFSCIFSPLASFFYISGIHVFFPLFALLRNSVEPRSTCLSPSCFFRVCPSTCQGVIC